MAFPLPILNCYLVILIFWIPVIFVCLSLFTINDFNSKSAKFLIFVIFSHPFSSPLLPFRSPFLSFFSLSPLPLQVIFYQMRENISLLLSHKLIQRGYICGQASSPESTLPLLQDPLNQVCPHMYS